MKCLHAQLRGYSCLNINQLILNKPETYTTSGRSIMTQVARRLFWFFSGKNSGPSNQMNTVYFTLNCLESFFGSSTSQYDNKHSHSFSRSAINYESVKKWEIEAWDQYNSHKAVRVSQTVANAGKKAARTPVKEINMFKQPHHWVIE